MDAQDERCAKCGGPMRCDMKAGRETCWCAALPAVMPLPEGESSCLCRSCLEAEIKSRRR